MCIYRLRDTKTRIALAKNDFWKHNELKGQRRGFQIVNVFSVLKYGSDSWSPHLNKYLAKCSPRDLPDTWHLLPRGVGVNGAVGCGC